MWTIMLHGGATEIPRDKEDVYKNGCRVALEIGRKILQNGGSAVDAVVAATVSLENDSTFNAGYGSVLNDCNEVEMSAAVMDGKTMDVGAVAIVQGVRNPVKVAQLMLPEQTILIAGEGARRFAAKKGAELCEPEECVAPERKEKRTGTHDTVGCIALDTSGNFAAASSTGGIENRPKGRIGDSPLPGCGYYAENGAGCVTLSGDGEFIARMTLAARITHIIPMLGPQEAVEASLEKMKKIGGEAGAIAMGADGSIGWAHNSSEFAVGIASSNRPAQVYLRKNEERN